MLSSLLFSSAYSLVRGFLCRKQTCTVTVIHNWTDHRQLIALAPEQVSIDSRVSADNRIDSSWSSQRSQHAMKPDIGSKSRFMPTQPTLLHSTPQLGGLPSEYCHNVWYGKNRMVWLPDDENILKICLFVLTECTNTTDTRTDRRTDTACMAKAALA